MPLPIRFEPDLSAVQRAIAPHGMGALIRRRRQVGTRSVAALFATLALLAAAPGMASAKTYRLAIAGDEGARFAGRCTIAGDGSDETVELEGGTPFERTFAGEGIVCSFEARGRLVVEIVYDGGRSRAATSGGTIRIAAR